MASLFVVFGAGVYKRRVLGTGVVNLAGMVDRIGLWVGNRSLGVAKAVALVRASSGLGLLNCFWQLTWALILLSLVSKDRQRSVSFLYVSRSTSMAASLSWRGVVSLLYRSNQRLSAGISALLARCRKIV